MAERPPQIARFRVPATLPPDSYGLLRGDFFATPSWYDTVIEHGLAPHTEPVFVTIRQGGRALAVFPMQLAGARVSALTTPYTSLWRPLLAPWLSLIQMRQCGKSFGLWCRAHGSVRLDCLEPNDPCWTPLVAGMREAGLRVSPFAHFGNWHTETAGLSWETYLARRPGALRESIRRRSRKLEAEGGVCRIVTTGPELPAAIHAYETVYAKSWKQREPFPEFNAALMRTCAENGSLRLGLLELNGTPIAVQLWVKQNNWAGVLKLAHDEEYKAASPGTVLTAFMIRHLLDAERVHELDFGRGDDPYKQDWAPLRRPRSGLLLANPWSARGMAAILRGAAGQAVKHIRRGLRAVRHARPSNQP